MSESLPTDPAALPPGAKRALVTLTTLVISIMATIDSTIVAVCMPQMQGTLDATPVTIVWVMTMFNIGQAIGIAITGKLALLYGRRQVMLAAIVGFVALSCVCGFVGTLDGMVIARFFQGLFAAPLIPLSQAIIVDAFPVEQRARGLSVWSMGVILGPAIGPAVGGWLTEHIDWRMCFYVNVPIGVIALFLCLVYVRPTGTRAVKIDWIGFLLIALVVVPLQIGLDQGDTLDWFSSKIIVALFGTATLAGIAFVARGLLVDNNILPLRLFTDRNFSLSTLAISFLGIAIFSQSALYPVMLEDLLGWQVDTAGLVMGTFGIGGFFGSLVAPRVVATFGPRVSMAIGAIVVAIGQYIGLGLNLDMSPWQAPIPGMLAVFGIMLAYVPTTGIAFSNVAPRDRDDATAEYNFLKTVAMSIGVSMVSTLLYRRPQLHWNALASNVRADNPALRHYVDALGATTWDAHVAIIVRDLVWAQATMLAIIDVFLVVIGIAAAIVVVAALARSTKAVKATVAAE